MNVARGEPDSFNVSVVLALSSSLCHSTERILRSPEIRDFVTPPLDTVHPDAPIMAGRLNHRTC